MAVLVAAKKEKNMFLDRHPTRFSSLGLGALTLLTSLLLPAASRGEELASRDPRQAFGLADEAQAAPLAKPGRLIPSHELKLAVLPAPLVSLSPVNRDALVKEDEMKSLLGMEKRVRYGIGRNVALRAADGHWYDLADGGRLWTVDLKSPAALGLRLHFDRLRLPAGARIAVYSPDDLDRAAHYRRTGEDLQGEPRAEQLESAELLSKGGWTGTVAGDTARIEVVLPRGAKSRALPFVLDQVQHLYRDPVSLDLEKGAGSCHNDVTCFSAWSTTVANAVARIGFVENGGSFLCTGQLLNNNNIDRTPYFLTAHHCLSDNAAAQTLEAFWKFQTATCNGAPPSLGSVPTSTGATLLATGATSDFTFLMIDGALPPGLFWAGWTSSIVPAGTASASIHHPAGDFKRISFGKNALATPGCASGTNVNGGSHVRINWSSGPTEQGSSGAGIFRSDTQQLYGQLHCGPSSCADVSNDSYGSFFVTFPSISTLLQGGSDDSLEPNDNCFTPHFLNPGTYNNLIVRFNDDDYYRTSVPNGQTLTVTLNFIHANGDIDTSMHYDCETPGITSSGSSSNHEVMTYHHTTGSDQNVSWRVFLFTDTRNTYNMTFTVQ